VFVLLSQKNRKSPYVCGVCVGGGGVMFIVNGKTYICHQKNKNNSMPKRKGRVKTLNWYKT
jgi:hypothetical protein